MRFANLLIDTSKVVGVIEPTVFGSFVEHLGRSVYDGLYEPTHEKSNPQGFRNDVLEAIQELGVSIIRYPGGNFVSQYRWKNAVGPKEKRPANLNVAWHEIEPNLVGIDEMIPEMKAIGCDTMLAFNLGIGSIQDSADLVEYCNLNTPTQYAKMRVENGHREPYGIAYWCLGNEMDGSWQVCHMSADDYAKKAIAVAEIVKLTDPEAKTIIAGSNSPYSPTFPEWDKTVVHAAFDKVDFLALHCYFTYPNIQEKDVHEYLGVASDLENYLLVAEKIIEEERIARKSEKKLYLSIDEWNIWHQSDCSAASGEKQWSYANHLLEQSYDYADSLAFTSLLLTILNHANTVKLACLAQLVNVLAPILTEHDGGILKQTIYYPFAVLANSVKGYQSLSVSGETPHYLTKRFGEVKTLYQNVAYNKEKGEYVVSLLNVGEEEIDLNLEFPSMGELVKEWKLEGFSAHQKNTFDAPFAVFPQQSKCSIRVDRKLHRCLKPLSFYVLYINERR